MEILTTLLGSVTHITLILLFECIFLFVILYPVLNRLAARMTSVLNKKLFTTLMDLGLNAQITTNQNGEPEFKQPIITLFEACAVDEKNYLKMQKNMPYIVTAILFFVLFVCGIIFIIISIYTNLVIDYKLVFITSIISFALICGYIFMVLWYILVLQPYVLNYEADIYNIILEIYNSA